LSLFYVTLEHVRHVMERPLLRGRLGQEYLERFFARFSQGKPILDRSSLATQGYAVHRLGTDRVGALGANFQVVKPIGMAFSLGILVMYLDGQAVRVTEFDFGFQ